MNAKLYLLGDTLGERFQIKKNLVAIMTLTLALAYGGGLWLHVVHQTDGATEVNEPPALIHWLRDSTLMVPVVSASVIVALVFARRLLRSYRQSASRLHESVVVVGSIALITSGALALASPIHNILFQAHHPARHQPVDSKTLLALQQGDTDTIRALQQSNALALITPQPVDEEMPLLVHMLYDGTLAFEGNLVFAGIVYVLFRGRLWRMQAI